MCPINAPYPWHGAHLLTPTLLRLSTLSATSRKEGKKVPPNPLYRLRKRGWSSEAPIGWVNYATCLTNNIVFTLVNINILLGTLMSGSLILVALSAR